MIEAEHELDRYARLAGAARRRLPALRPMQVPAADELAVFPLASSHVNRWPLRAMGEAAARVAAARGLKIAVVVGERVGGELEEAVAAGFFGPQPQIVIGAPGDFHSVAARIAAAAGYLGDRHGACPPRCGVRVAGRGGTRRRLLAALRPVGGALGRGGGADPVLRLRVGLRVRARFLQRGVDADSLVAAFDTAYAGASDGPFIHALDAYGARERTIFEAAANVHRGGAAGPGPLG